MAATTFEAKSYVSPAVVSHNRCIKRVSIAESFTLDEANDIVKFFKLPAEGFKLLDGGILSADLDTNGTPTVTVSLIVTDGTTTYTLLSASTIAQAGGYAGALSTGVSGANVSNWLGKCCKGRDWYAGVKIVAAPATAAAGNVQVMLEYTCDMEDGELSSAA